MPPLKALARPSGYGYREESVSLFEKIRKQGIAAATPTRS
jgi:hypothetical protein